MFPDRWGCCSFWLTAHLCHDNKAIHNPACQTLLYYELTCSTFAVFWIIFPFPMSLLLFHFECWYKMSFWRFKMVHYLKKKAKTKPWLFIAACICFCLWIKQGFLWVNRFFMRFHRAVSESCLHIRVTPTLIWRCSSYFLLRFKWMQLSHLLR